MRIHYYVDYKSIKITMTNKCQATPVLLLQERGPVENQEIKWNKENVCECLMSVRAGTGRRSQLTSEGKDFPKSLCKTTADPAADSRTQAAAALPGPPGKPTESLQPLVILLLHRHPTHETYNFTDMIILECAKAEVYVNRHVCDVRYHSGQTGRFCQ